MQLIKAGSSKWCNRNCGCSNRLLTTKASRGSGAAGLAIYYNGGIHTAFGPMTMSRRRRILTGIGIAVVVSGAYLYLFGLQTAFALMERYECRKISVAWETPVPLADLSISATPHRETSFCGYRFELPWGDVDEQKSRTVGEGVQVTAFRSKNVFSFSCFPPRNFVGEVMKQMNLNADQLKRGFGEAADSDYGFNRIMLDVRPDSITLRTPEREAWRDSMLLMFKVRAIPPTDSGIFLVQTPEFKGFQFGAPPRRQFRITDYLYTDSGGINLVFFQDRQGTAPAISQAEINRVVQSVRKIAEVEPGVREKSGP